MEEVLSNQEARPGDATQLMHASKRLRDSILLSVFSSHIFARYKNEALWI